MAGVLVGLFVAVGLVLAYRGGWLGHGLGAPAGLRAELAKRWPRGARGGRGRLLQRSAAAEAYAEAELSNGRRSGKNGGGEEPGKKNGSMKLKPLTRASADEMASTEDQEACWKGVTTARL